MNKRNKTTFNIPYLLQIIKHLQNVFSFFFLSDFQRPQNGHKLFTHTHFVVRSYVLRRQNVFPTIKHTPYKDDDRLWFSLNVYKIVQVNS